MAEEIIEREEIVENEPNIETEPNKGDEGDGKKEEKEVKWEELPEDVRKYIDRERTKASQTAREKAKRDALKDPEVQQAIKAQLEEEARLTAEEKVARTLAEVARRENALDAREKLQKAGIIGEQLHTILDLVVSDDKVATLEKTDSFISTFTAMVDSATEAKTRELIKGTPKPKSSTTVTKAFKDMGFDERQALKEADPAKFKAEVAKLSRKI